MATKNIALVTGGYSGEAQVSYNSAKTIQANIDNTLFTCYTIDITPDGWWFTSDGDEKHTVDKNDFSITLNGRKITFEAVLMGIHGTPGEDGRLQGYFDLLKIPYTSCGASVSALTFNKRFTVAVAAMSGISVARSLHFYKSSSIDVDAIVGQLNFPLFIKPANGGSSIGMSKVPDATGLFEAMQKAFAEDDQVLVEEFIEGREFSIGVFKMGDEVVVLPITEVVSQNYFFDYEAKYEGKSSETTPADIPEELADLLRQTAKQVYTVFNCSGVIRIDFIYNEATGKPFMLEINTVPGQSAASIVPQQVRAMGWELKAFYTQLLNQCLHAKPANR